MKIFSRNSHSTPHMKSFERAGQFVNPETDSQNDGIAFEVGTDLFMNLAFVMLIAAQMHVQSLPVAGKMPENGSQDTKPQLVLYLSRDGKAARVGAPNASLSVTTPEASEVLTRELKARGAQQFVIAAPEGLPVEAAQVWLDRMTGIIKKIPGADVALAVVHQTDH
jgi:hypothetical protein